MNTVPNPAAERTSLPLLVVAGLAVLVIQALRDAGLPMPPLTEVVRLLGVPRQRAYEMAEQIREAITHLPRPVGRPPSPEAAEVPDDPRYAVCRAVRCFLETHPGAHVARDARDGYSAGFRRFIMRLRQRGAAGQSLSLPTFAQATGVPIETLRDWLSNRRQPRVEQDDSSPSDDAPPPPLYPDGVIDQIVTLWRRTSPVKLAHFARILAQQHRIRMPVRALVEILQLSGDRARARPRKPKPDPEAVRGALERFFPGAQWAADGKHVTVSIGEKTFSFNWELAVDNFTGAHVGFDVRDAEDSVGVINTLESGVQTTGAPPMALLLDNRPSNTTDEVSRAVDDRGALLMHSTLGRAENKASVEGAFGLFAQTMPPIGIKRQLEPRELARSVLRIALFAYCAGRNHVPRAGLGGRSASDAYLDFIPTDDERQWAYQRLLDIQRRIAQRNDANAAREYPACRTMIEDLFREIGIQDPDGCLTHAIAKHGVRAISEAIAILKAKLEAGESFEHAGRYLAGIARNVAERNHHLALYEHALELRLQAQDQMLAPLLERDRKWSATLEPDAYIDHVVDAALGDVPCIDRAFWRRKLINALRQLPPGQLPDRIAGIVRIVATSYQVPKHHRDLLIDALIDAQVEAAAA